MPRKPKKPEPEVTRRQFVAFLATLLIPGLAILLWFGLLIGEVPGDRTIDASRFVVQVDSFLTAGFIVGVIWYWEALLRRIKEVKLPFPSGWETVTNLVFPFVGFALSAFLAIGGILTADIRYLEWALFLTSYALINVIGLLYLLHKSMAAVESAQTAQELQSG